MTRDPQRLGDYLGHILEAIERIEEYVLDMDERLSSAANSYRMP
jgi:uncharacterized protein with HEPN domain